MTFADVTKLDITQNEFDMFNNFFYLKHLSNPSESDRKYYITLGDKIYNSPDLLAKFRKFEYIEKYYDKSNCKSYGDYIKECFNAKS